MDLEGHRRATARQAHAVYLLTLPGFDGRKPVPGTTLESLAQDLRKLIETQDLQARCSSATAWAARCRWRSPPNIPTDRRCGGGRWPAGFSRHREHDGDRSALGQGMRAQIESQTPEQFAESTSRLT